jgi:hypothetical protein
MLITVENLRQINYFLDVMLSKLIFLILWKKVKKQSIYIDLDKYTFTYEYKKMWMAGFRIYVLIAKHGKKNFIIPFEFDKSAEYKVVFLAFL